MKIAQKPAASLYDEEYFPLPDPDDEPEDELEEEEDYD